MATYSPKVFPKEFAQDLVQEAMFGNETVSRPLVRIEDGIKDQRIITSKYGTVSVQAYKSNPQESDMTDGLGFRDAMMQPVKSMILEKFDPEDLRTSRFNADMLQGAKNITSNKAEQELIALMVELMGPAIETSFWGGITSATKTAIAALTTGTGVGQASTTEKAWAAAQTTGRTDGIVAKMIYDGLKLDASAQPVGGATEVINVPGTTINTGNLAAEYAKVYAAIPAVLMKRPYFGKLKWFAPFEHMQLINQVNIAATYRDIFVVSGDKYTYLNIPIEFVPLPANCMTVGIFDEYVLGTDATSDFTEFEIGKVKNYGDLMFFKAVFTLEAAIINGKQKVLYL